MKLTTLGVAALAALLVTAGAAAAVPGQASDAGAAHANDSTNQTTTQNETTTTQADAAANETDSTNASEQRGPPVDGLPSQVPDHVTEIHQAIDDFLSGAIDSLGDVVRGIASGASPGQADDHAKNGTAGDSGHGKPAHAGPRN